MAVYHPLRLETSFKWQAITKHLKQSNPSLHYSLFKISLFRCHWFIMSVMISQSVAYYHQNSLTAVGSVQSADCNRWTFFLNLSWGEKLLFLPYLLWRFMIQIKYLRKMKETVLDFLHTGFVCLFLHLLWIPIQNFNSVNFKIPCNLGLKW